MIANAAAEVYSKNDESIEYNRNKEAEYEGIKSTAEGEKAGMTSGVDGLKSTYDEKLNLKNTSA